MPRTPGTWTTSEQARAARLGRGRLQRAHAKGGRALSVTEYRRRLRQMVPEALAALADALKNPRERVVAAKVVLERGFPPSVVAAIESAGAVRFTISFDRPWSDLDDTERDEVEADDEESAESSVALPAPENARTPRV